MLEAIGYAGVFILFALSVISGNAEVQRKRIKEEKRKAVILRLTSIKDNFKYKLKRFVELEILNEKQYESVYRIANNFFVFQPITGQNVEFYLAELSRVIIALSKNGVSSTFSERVQDQINLFISQLPVDSIDFSATFYNKTLPLLITQLIDAKNEICSGDVSTDVDDIIDTDKEDAVDTGIDNVATDADQDDAKSVDMNDAIDVNINEEPLSSPALVTSPEHNS